jgi:hypothetical protein
LKTGKECVTTHLPNGVAFKMDVGNNWMVDAIYLKSICGILGRLVISLYRKLNENLI